jgi:hypothetical protein
MPAQLVPWVFAMSAGFEFVDKMFSNDPAVPFRAWAWMAELVP